MSRCDESGKELTDDDLWLPLVVEDIVAVLDAERIAEVAVYGSSYGTYVVQDVAAEHPERVPCLLLDSAMLSAKDHVETRAASREGISSSCPTVGTACWM